jgi:hypothetical protein
LATSRLVLRLRAEREYIVRPLSLPADPALPVEELAFTPAVALFVDRARAVRYEFALTEDNAGAVAEICRRLEGLPLAIELAAARIRLLAPAELLRRLATSLDALGTGSVDLPERQRTLRATVEWSVDLLGDDERDLLETAAVFVDGWTTNAAAAVADLDLERTLDLTEALARHSLISLDIRDRGPRPRMLDTIRAFLAERLAARSRRRRDPAPLCRVARRLARLALAWIRPNTGDYEGALREALRSLDVLRAHDEPYWTGVAVVTVAGYEMATGRNDDARRHLLECREAADRSGYDWLSAWSRTQLATLALASDHWDDARALLDESLGLSLTIHSNRNVSLILLGFARLAVAAHDPERAARLAGAADGLRKRYGHRPWPALQQGEDELRTQLREALGPGRFKDASAAGEQLAQREAIALARGMHAGAPAG